MARNDNFAWIEHDKGYTRDNKISLPMIYRSVELAIQYIGVLIFSWLP